MPGEQRAMEFAHVVLLACVASYLVLLVVGPISVVDAMCGVDLGGGINMTADGQIKVKNASPQGPMCFPEESEYDGITMP